MPMRSKSFRKDNFVGFAKLNMPFVYRRLRGGQRIKGSRKSPIVSSSGKFFDILRKEREHFMHWGSAIHCATFYQGLVPQEQLLERIAAIVDSNPWLAGRLVTDRQRKQPVLWVPDEPCIAQVFKLVNDPALREEISYDELNRRVVEHGVRPGFRLLDADRPLFRVTVLRCNEGCFFLTMSLSHVIADGNTFYQIHRMLDTSQPIKALDPARVQTFVDQSREAVGCTMYDWFASKRFLLSSLCHNLFGRDGRTKAALYKINADWLAGEKERAANKEVKYVSSNDVVTSEINKICDADYGAMAVDYRSRLPGLHADLAGNYVETIVFFREDIARGSTAIRQAIDGSKRPTYGRPSVKETAGMRMSYITNWATFHHDVKLDGCQAGDHFPILDLMALANLSLPAK